MPNSAISAGDRPSTGRNSVTTKLVGILHKGWSEAKCVIVNVIFVAYFQMPHTRS